MTFGLSDEPQLPSEEEWQRGGQVGERLVRMAIGERMLRRLERGANPATNMAIAFGALTEVCGLLRALSRPESLLTVEQHAVAHVRGALRHAGRPVNEDGSPWTTSTPAMTPRAPGPQTAAPAWEFEPPSHERALDEARKAALRLLWCAAKQAGGVLRIHCETMAAMPPDAELSTALSLDGRDQIIVAVPRGDAN